VPGAVGDSCDNVTSGCVRGAECISGVCDIDETSPCGVDASILEFGTVGATPVQRVADTTGRPNLDSGSCRFETIDDTGEVVIRFVPETSGTLLASTDLAGTGAADSLLYLRSGTCGDPDSEVACDDDGGTGLTSRLVAPVTAGVTYYLFVDSYEIGGAALAVELSVSPNIPSGSACDTTDDSAVCEPGSECLTTPGGGEVCGRLVSLGQACDDTATFCRPGLVCETGTCETDALSPCGAGVSVTDLGIVSTAGITRGFSTGINPSVLDGSCGFSFAPPETVFALIPAADGTLFVNTNLGANAGADTIISVREAACTEASAEIACDEDVSAANFLTESLVPVVAGRTYYVVIEASPGPFEGQVSFSLVLPAPVGAPCDPGVGRVGCEAGARCLDDGSGAFVCTAVSGLFEPCDAPDTTCAYGLICDLGLCVEDPAEPCGPDTPSFDYTLLGSDPDGRRFLDYPDLADTGNYTVLDCGGVDTAGGEVAFVFAATFTGTLVVETSDTFGETDPALWYSLGQCHAPPSACIDDMPDGSLTPRLDLPVVAGETYYIFVDAVFGTLGGRVTFTELPAD
jgi:hypothetical protein